jgi:KilA-N domain
MVVPTIMVGSPWPPVSSWVSEHLGVVEPFSCPCHEGVSMKSPVATKAPTITYHVFNGTPVGQRLDDGYWEARALCKAFGKLTGNYLQSKDKQEFLEALSDDIGIPISELIQVVRGGDPSKQGTWAQTSPYKKTYTARGLRCLYIPMAGETDQMQKREHRPRICYHAP